MISIYFASLRQLLSQFPTITEMEINEKVRTPYEGFFKARIQFHDGSELSIREYVSTMTGSPERFSFSYHYFKNSQLIFRYDNAPHFPSLPSFPNHKHLASGEVIGCQRLTLKDILEEIETMFIRRSES